MPELYLKIISILPLTQPLAEHLNSTLSRSQPNPGISLFADIVVLSDTLLVGILDDGGFPLLLGVTHVHQGIALLLIGCPLLSALDRMTLLPLDSTAPPFNVVLHLGLLHQLHVGHCPLTITDDGTDP